MKTPMQISSPLSSLPFLGCGHILWKVPLTTQDKAGIGYQMDGQTSKDGILAERIWPTLTDFPWLLLCNELVIKF